MAVIIPGKMGEDNYEGLLYYLSDSAILTESVDCSAELTKLPIEKGSPITDHIIVQQPNLKITGVISDSGEVSILKSVDNLANMYHGIKPTEEFVHIAFSTIERVEIMDVITSKATYKDMILTNFTLGVSASNGDCIDYSLTFEHVVFVEPKFGTISVTPQQPQPETNLGKQQTKGAKEKIKTNKPQTPTNKSMAKNIKDKMPSVKDFFEGLFKFGG